LGVHSPSALSTTAAASAVVVVVASTKEAVVSRQQDEGQQRGARAGSKQGAATQEQQGQQVVVVVVVAVASAVVVVSSVVSGQEDQGEQGAEVRHLQKKQLFGHVNMSGDTANTDTNIWNVKWEMADRLRTKTIWLKLASGCSSETYKKKK